MKEFLNMKKALKITGIVLLVLIILIIAAPFLFEKQMVNYVKKTVNENLNATVAFNDYDLSFIRNFPQASLQLEELSVINNAPFEGDTLVYAGNVDLNMSLKEILKSGDEPKKINSFKIQDAYVNIVVDSLGNANYDIALQEETPAVGEDKPASGFSLDVEHYEIENSEIRYRDAASKMDFRLQEFDHQGSGNFANAVSTLSTTSSGVVSFEMDGSNLLNRMGLKLDADIEIDLENQKYTFLENEARINQLPLHFEGFVKLNEANTEMDIAFNTPSSDFKNFLAVMPEEYSKNIENVQTSGDFVVNGKIFGIVDEVHIPKMDIQIRSENASFKYPDLPKSVKNIFINTMIQNETGLMEDTYVNIENLSFTIDQDQFAARGNLRNLTGNMLVEMAANGRINLANIKQAYPVEMEHDLNGILVADMNTSFDMESIEKEQYQNVKSSGTASITNFKYKYEEFPNEILISEARMKFQPSAVQLENMEMKTGQSDLKLAGTLNNLMGYLFTDQQLKGNFNATSNTFAVSDFMAAETPTQDQQEGQTTSEASSEAFKMPDFLDVSLNFNANRVLYDNLVLENTKGTLAIKDETATLTNVTTNMLDGNIALNGNVSTKGEVPDFVMGLQLNSINIVKAFSQMEMIQRLAPIAEALEGSLNLNMDLNGNLTKDLTPNLQSLSGNALAQIISARVNPERTPLLSRMDESLKFVDMDNLNLKDLSTALVFNNGAVEVKPFDFNIKDIKVTAGGSHNFDMNMNYDLNLDVPAKYFGNDIGNIYSQLSGQEAQNMKVDLPVNITGTFQSPKIRVNTQQAVNTLTKQIVDQQKDNLKDKGKEILGDILGGNSNNQQQSSQDSTATTPKKTEDVVKDKVKDILGGFGKKNN